MSLSPTDSLGRCLLDHRARRSRQQISVKLKHLGVPLDESSLFQYEAGTVWAPDPGVLWGLAEIYRVPLMELILLLKANRARPGADPSKWSDLLRHSRDQALDAHQGGPVDATASARILELERELADYKARFSDVQDVTRRLFAIAVDREEGPATTTAAPRRSRTRRSTHR